MALTVGVTIIIERLQEKRMWDNEERRLTERTALRQQFVGLQMDSVQGWESLGDTLREKGDLKGSQESYYTARGLIEQQSQNKPDAAWMTGATLQQKIKLVELDIAREANPEKFGMTLETRDQLCSRCGKLNPGISRECFECGNMLATDSFWEAWQNPKLRSLIQKDTKKFALMLGVVVIAIAFGWALPFMQMAILAFATVCVLAFIFLRNLGNPTVGDD